MLFLHMHKLMENGFTPCQPIQPLAQVWELILAGSKGATCRDTKEKSLSPSLLYVSIALLCPIQSSPKLSLSLIQLRVGLAMAQQFRHSCLGNPDLNPHTRCTYMVSWLPVLMSICFHGMMPAHLPTLEYQGACTL